MSQVTLQGKQQALMRVAGSRVAVLDAVASTKSHAQACVRALPVSPTTLKRIGAAAGMAASVFGTVVGLRKKQKLAEKAAAKSWSGNMLAQIALQLLAPVLLPVLQRYLQNYVKNQQGVSTGQPLGF